MLQVFVLQRFRPCCTMLHGGPLGGSYAPLQTHHCVTAPGTGEKARERTMDMPIVRVVALTLALALGMTLPASAQHPSTAQTVIKTWTLTLHGDVPPRESFGVEIPDAFRPSTSSPRTEPLAAAPAAPAHSAGGASNAPRAAAPPAPPRAWRVLRPHTLLPRHLLRAYRTFRHR